MSFQKRLLDTGPVVVLITNGSKGSQKVHKHFKNEKKMDFTLILSRCDKLFTYKFVIFFTQSACLSKELEFSNLTKRWYFLLKLHYFVKQLPK